jgi:hypothetical protein
MYDIRAVPSLGTECQRVDNRGKKRSGNVILEVLGKSFIFLCTSRRVAVLLNEEEKDSAAPLLQLQNAYKLIIVSDVMNSNQQYKH